MRRQIQWNQRVIVVVVPAVGETFSDRLRDVKWDTHEMDFGNGVVVEGG